MRRPASACRHPAHDYRDFVRWQAELLAGRDGDRLWHYWKQQLAGAPLVLDLPTDRPRPPVFSRSGGTVPWRLEPDLIRRLKALAASEGTTLYAVLLAAFPFRSAATPARIDFLVGCPFAGRSRPGFENVIGYFINMLPLRADLSGDPPFSALLRRVGTTVLDALQHQDYPVPPPGGAAECRARPQPRTTRAGLVHAREGPSLRSSSARGVFSSPRREPNSRWGICGRAILRRAELQSDRSGNGLRGRRRHRRRNAPLQ